MAYFFKIKLRSRSPHFIPNLCQKFAAGTDFLKNQTNNSHLGLIDKVKVDS
jgi:hypothetical protein